MFRILLLVLLLLMVAMQYRLWVGDGGWAEVANLRGQIEVLSESNMVLNTRNQALEAEVKSLKTGDDAMEERARSDLGMVKKEEDFFLIVKPQKRDVSDAVEPASGITEDP